MVKLLLRTTWLTIYVWYMKWSTDLVEKQLKRMDEYEAAVADVQDCMASINYEMGVMARNLERGSGMNKDRFEKDGKRFDFLVIKYKYLRFKWNIRGFIVEILLLDRKRRGKNEKNTK